MPARPLRTPRERRRRSGLRTALSNPLYRSGYALVVNTLGTTGLGFMFWALAAHLYTPQAVGRSSALVAALVLVSSFAQLNLGNTMPRFLPQTGRRAGRFIVYCYGTSSAAALALGAGFVVLMPRLVPRWQFLGASPALSAVFVAAVVAWGVFSLQDAALLSLRRSVAVPVENAVFGVGKLALLAGFAAAAPSAGIFVSWVAALLFTVPAVNWLIFRRYLARRESATEVATVRPRDVVRFASLDYLGAIIGQATGNLLPLVVLSTLGAAANSTFYFAWTISTGLSMVVANFSTSLLVEGAAAPDRLPELTRGVLARSALVTVPGAAALVLAGRWVLDIYGHEYSVHGAVLLGLLAVSTIPNSLIATALSLDRLAGRVGRAALTRLMLAVVMLGATWLLLRRQGVDGVGLAVLGANVAVAVARFPAVAIEASRRRAAAGAAARRIGRSARGRPAEGGFRRRPPGRHRAGARGAASAQATGRRIPAPVGQTTSTGASR